MPREHLDVLLQRLASSADLLPAVLQQGRRKALALVLRKSAKAVLHLDGLIARRVPHSHRLGVLLVVVVFVLLLQLLKVVFVVFGCVSGRKTFNAACCWPTKPRSIVKT